MKRNVINPYRLLLWGLDLIIKMIIHPKVILDYELLVFCLLVQYKIFIFAVFNVVTNIKYRGS